MKMMLVYPLMLLIFSDFYCKSVAGIGGLGDRINFRHHELACDGYPISLRCPGKDVIEVVSAEYGRRNTDTCATTNAAEMQNTKCRLPQATNILSTSCNNQTQCTMQVAVHNFPDPCPETHKYLEVTYKCLKYMFGCPGTLTGIGSNRTIETAMQLQAGSWTKDPLFKSDHIFYHAASNQFIQEYTSMDAFVQGRMLKTHDLNNQISDVGYVVYDGNIFYVKFLSSVNRFVVKYNIRSGLRVRESRMPGRYVTTSTPRDIFDRVMLAVDETGLWTMYATEESKFIIISRLDTNSLQIQKTWTTGYQKTAASHAFMICGMLYVVSAHNGEVVYIYNTKLSTGKMVQIGFDRNRPLAGTTSRRRATFATYSFTSLRYNPRDRLLYAWQAAHGHAVSYQLHFTELNRDLNPTTTNAAASRVSPPTTATPVVAPTSRPPLDAADYCRATEQAGIMWPATTAGNVRTMPCNADVGTGESAMWQCLRGGRWEISGPDTSNCVVTPIGVILNRVREGKGESEQLVSQLWRVLQRRGVGDLTSADVVDAAQIMWQATAVTATDGGSPTQLRQLARATVGSADLLTADNLRDAWSRMSAQQRHMTAHNIQLSVEQAAFVAVSSHPRNDNFESEGDNLLVQAEQRYGDGEDVVRFPQPISTLGWEQATDSVSLPAVNLRNEGNGIVTFALYKSLADMAVAKYENVVDSDDDRSWFIDSHLVSLSITRPPTNYQLEITRLKSPLQLTLQHKQDRNASRRCVYWSFNPSSGTASWRDDGSCHVATSNNSHTTCACDHLTSFAVAMTTDDNDGVVTRVTAWQHQTELSAVASIGACISALCLLVIWCTFAFFRNVQSDHNTIMKHLTFTLFCTELAFLIGMHQPASSLPCQLLACLLHYALLATFIWMAIESFQLYVLLVEFMEGRSRSKWYCLIAYGVPAAVVMVRAGIELSGHGSWDEYSCWLSDDSGLIWSVVGPLCATILCNLILLVVTVVKIYRQNVSYTDCAKLKSIKVSIRISSAFLCLSIITWTFCILWLWEMSAITAYLFCVFNTFQGIFLVFVHCVLDRQVRDEYASRFGSLCCGGKSGRDSYVSSSISFSKQYTAGRYSSTPATSCGLNNTTLTATHTTSSQSQLRRMWTETVVNNNGLPCSADTALVHSHEMNTVPASRDMTVHGGRGMLQHTSALHHPRQYSSQSRLNAQQSGGVATSLERLVDNYPAEDQNHRTRSDDEVFYPMQKEQEDAYKYDRLDHRHARYPDAPDCPHHHQYNDCHPPPPPHAACHRSFTMEHVTEPPSSSVQYFKSEGGGQQRASTLCNAEGMGGGGGVASRRWESPRVAKRMSQPSSSVDSCLHQHRTNQGCFSHTQPAVFLPSYDTNAQYPPSTFPSRLINQQPYQQPQQQQQRRRRSLTSSDSDDPIGNDSGSAGTSLNRVVRRVMHGPVIHEHEQLLLCEHHLQQRRLSSGDHDHHHREPWTPLHNYHHQHHRDDTDLEVQRLTNGPDHIADSKEEPKHAALVRVNGAECQRDSAFYQSMPDLNSHGISGGSQHRESSPPPPSISYSSPSSGCSPEMTSTEDDSVAYQERRGRGPRYILAPPHSFTSEKRTNADTLYEDIAIAPEVVRPIIAHQLDNDADSSTNPARMITSL